VFGLVDAAVARLITERRHRQLIEHLQELDDRLERVARRLVRRRA
jgi:hypothetical protein